MTSSAAKILWQPRVSTLSEVPQLLHFMRYCANLSNFHSGLQGAFSGDTHEEFYRWSIQEPQLFWRAWWQFLTLPGDVEARVIPRAEAPCSGVLASRILDQPAFVPGNNPQNTQWFPHLRVNYAEALLARGRPEQTAIISHVETRERREITFAELREQVHALAHYLQHIGIMPGDRVAAFLPNTQETIICYLACGLIGAIWSSVATDFGVEGACKRFAQINPKVLFIADGSIWKGAEVTFTSKNDALLRGLDAVQHVITIEIIGHRNACASSPQGRTLASFADIITTHRGAKVEVTRFPFNHPLTIVYSSGTTGVPKCIVHSTGGVLLEHLKEHILHHDIRSTDRFFYQTTCSWMMWHWLVSALGTGATICVTEGYPLLNDFTYLWNLAASEHLSVFGTNAKYLSLLESRNLPIGREIDLTSLRLILSTGSPLLESTFLYIARQIKENIPIASISGGTDLLGCFALGSPLLPVKAGHLQCRSLGLAVDVFDEQGQPIRNTTGELVCSNAFPSMPLYFLNDPDGRLYHEAYFHRYPGVWCHGDWAELSCDGSMKILGRSDSVLNPGGVRIGTGEIYAAISSIPEVVDAVAVPYRLPHDEEVALFVVLAAGKDLTPELRERIVTHLLTSLSRFHVPKHLFAVQDIPRTTNGKVMERLVRAIVNGQDRGDLSTLANQECLAAYEEAARTLRPPP